MLSDIEIAQQCRMKNISEIAAALKIPEDLVEPYGRYKAKIDYSALETKGKKGKREIRSFFPLPPAAIFVRLHRGFPSRESSILRGNRSTGAVSPD